MTNKVPIHSKPRVAVHKFSSCDGCQLAFLNMGEALVTLTQLVDIVHFAEAGPVDPDAKVDIAFVEGSVTTMEEIERIKHVRENASYLVAIGACATSGGLQALRSLAEVRDWTADIYASPHYIHTLDQATAIGAHVKVDLTLWGCPVNTRQVSAAVRALLFGVEPAVSRDKVCLECKRSGTVCTLVAHGKPCLGPVTNTGCGALCPRFGRDCHGCYGPSDNVNANALGRRFEGLGLLPDEVARRFLCIYSGARSLSDVGLKYKFKEPSHG